MTPLGSQTLYTLAEIRNEWFRLTLVMDNIYFNFNLDEIDSPYSQFREWKNRVIVK